MKVHEYMHAEVLNSPATAPPQAESGITSHKIFCFLSPKPENAHVDESKCCSCAPADMV